jgi:hypothetical protein
MKGEGAHMWQRRAVLLLLVLAVAGSACAPVIRNYNGNGVQVFVANEGPGAVLVAVQQEGGTRELGRVDRFEYRFFELDGRGSVVVSATPEHGAVMATDTIRLQPGRVIDLRLGIPPHQLRWSLY